MSNQSYYNSQSYGQPGQQQGNYQQTTAPQSHGQQHASNSNSSEAVIANLPDRGEQYETMQNYEASARQTEQDRDQETLQKEFPNVDGSLIAAIYGDSGSLSATREMLQALGDSK